MMWKWIAGVAAAPLGAAALVVGIGALLPRDHVAAADRFVPVDPASVAAMVRDVEHYPRWRSGVQRIESLLRDEQGARFVENGADDPIAFHLVEETPGTVQEHDRRSRSAVRWAVDDRADGRTSGNQDTNRGTRLRPSSGQSFLRALRLRA